MYSPNWTLESALQYMIIYFCTLHNINIALKRLDMLYNEHNTLTIYFFTLNVITVLWTRLQFYCEYEKV